jgi:hypothetical protein
MERCLQQLFQSQQFQSVYEVQQGQRDCCHRKSTRPGTRTLYTFNPFSDGKLIPNEQLGYILAMYQEGYISGNPDGSFNPNAALSRAQMASIIEKLLENGFDPDDEDAPTWNEDSKVEAVKVRSTSVDLRWTGAQDDVQVVGYKVIYEVDGEDVEKSVLGKNVTIKGLEPDEAYTLTVEA